MIINGKSLLELAPIKDMETAKIRYEGTSYGLSEAGYDIRIKQDIKIMHHPKSVYVHDKSTNKLDIFSGNFTIASAIEEFDMPNNLVGVVHDKSTWARKGLSVFNTVIEPGWKGFLTLELVHHGSHDLNIKAGQGIAQILFSEIIEKGDYGDGKYQNQENKPINARH